MRKLRERKETCCGAGGEVGDLVLGVGDQVSDAIGEELLQLLKQK